MSTLKTHNLQSPDSGSSNIALTPNAGMVVTGISTFSNNLDINANIDVSGTSTFGGNISGTGDLTLTDTDAGSSAGPEFKLFRNSASPADADYIGQIKFAGESDTGVERNYAKITGKILDASNGTEDGILEFAHIKAGSQTITGRFRSDSLQLLNGTALSVAGDKLFLYSFISGPAAEPSSADINSRFLPIKSLFDAVIVPDEIMLLFA